MERREPAMTEPLRLGILGCAKIADVFCQHLNSAARPGAPVRLVAAASRDAAKAAAFAARHGIARHHGSYEALLADTDVQAVYIPLPNTMHAEWAMRAAEAGKDVLCEKPLAMSRAEAQAMFAAARRAGVVLLEGYPWWFQPQTRDLLALLHDGSIGRVRSAVAYFGFSLAQPQGNIRMDPALGGGALLDAGCYALSLLRLAFGEAPVRVRADATWSGGAPGAGVDISLAATLHFADGRRAQMACAMDAAMHRRAIIVGEAGAVDTEYLNHTGSGSDGTGFQPSQMRVRRGAGNVPFEEVHSATGSGFRFEAEAFARVVAQGDFAAVERAAAASLDIAATLQALATSARERREVEVERPG